MTRGTIKSDDLESKLTAMLQLLDWHRQLVFDALETVKGHPAMKKNPKTHSPPKQVLPKRRDLSP
jgi:hypothetical protein